MQAADHDREVDFWRHMAIEAAEQFGTPCFVCSIQRLVDSAQKLEGLFEGIKPRQWLAVKAHPVPDVLRAWKTVGYGVEVVSPFELEAALDTGYVPERILVNGVAKHSWLRRYDLPGLHVHFDSAAEIDALALHARRNTWQLGLRYHPTVQYDPDDPGFEDQFGFTDGELGVVSQLIRRLDVPIAGIHFHLRSNVRSPDVYEEAINETLAACRSNGIDPHYLDCGGGLPVAEEEPIWEKTDGSAFSLESYAKVLAAVSQKCPSIREIWMENGRFISSASAALVIRVLDIKDRDNSRYLICDGGRTNQAMVSEWQRNPITTVPARTGPTRLTTICGPTCMAYDRLARVELPSSVKAGDLLVWRNAGAYHIPWETRFSFGLSAVVVIGTDNTVRLARRAESYSDWWNMWRKGGMS